MFSLLVPLYQLRPFDESDPRWSPLHFREQVTGIPGTPAFGNPQEPPEHKAWIITGAYISTLPAAGSVALNAELRLLIGTTGLLAHVLASKIPTSQLVAGEAVAATQQCNIIVIGGVHNVNATWGVTVGNVANIFAWGFHGYEIPRGNVALR